MIVTLWITAEPDDDQELLIQYTNQIRSFLEQPRKGSGEDPAHLLIGISSEFYVHKPSRYKLEYTVHSDFASSLKKTKAAPQT